MYQERNIIMQGNILFYVIGGLIAVGIIIAIVFIVKRNNNIKKNGYPTVVTTVEADGAAQNMTEYKYTFDGDQNLFKRQLHRD